MDYKSANIVLELFCASVTALLALQLLISENRKTRRNRLLTAVMILHTLVLLCDALTWAFDGVMEPDLRGAMNAANCFLYIGSGGVLFLYADYIFSGIWPDRRTPHCITYIVATSCLIGVAAVIASQFNGKLYYIDELNWFHFGPWHLKLGIFFICVSVFVSLVILHYGKFLEKKEILSYLSYIVFVLISAVPQVIFPELMLLYAAFTLSLLIIFINIQLQQEKRLLDKELELANAHAAMMISQIQPHFLYNTLSTVTNLCTRNPELARKTIIEFSHYLRTNLASLTQKKLVPLGEELEHVDTYLSLVARRFGEKVRVEYETAATDFCLPPLTIQPIVENAVQHGIAAREGGGTIVIHTTEEEGEWRICVTDDGVGFDTETLPKSKDAHIGLDNVRFRLENMCRGSLDIHSTPGRGTAAVIKIPKNTGTIERARER